ncbi:hypothetical protein [Actinokineospora inagensis]|uniref:hypothetical protein n=1 Tax=Actinokineospora inagensis TaxID=103730 RepID=UPI000425F8D9|nr:hypothetical protein [Actinokineospora inagensis]
MTLRIDHEAVAALATEVADLRTAVSDVVGYARADTLAPSRFGVLGARAGKAFADVHTEIVAAIEKSGADLANTVAGLRTAVERITETDHDAAQRITRAGER